MFQEAVFPVCVCAPMLSMFVYTPVFVSAVCVCVCVCVCACVWPKEDVDMKATGEQVLSNHKRKHEASPV